MHDTELDHYVLDLLHHAAMVLEETDWDWSVVLRDDADVPWTVRGQDELESMRDDGAGWPAEIIRQAGDYARHASLSRHGIALSVRAAAEWYGAGDAEAAIAYLWDAEEREADLVGGDGASLLVEVRTALAYCLTTPRGAARDQVLSMVSDQHGLPIPARQLGWLQVIQLATDGRSHSGTFPPVALHLRR